MNETYNSEANFVATTEVQDKPKKVELTYEEKVAQTAQAFLSVETSDKDKLKAASSLSRYQRASTGPLGTDKFSGILETSGLNMADVDQFVADNRREILSKEVRLEEEETARLENPAKIAEAAKEARVKLRSMDGGGEIAGAIDALEATKEKKTVVVEENEDPNLETREEVEVINTNRLDAVEKYYNEHVVSVVDNPEMHGLVVDAMKPLMESIKNELVHNHLARVDKGTEGSQDVMNMTKYFKDKLDFIMTLDMQTYNEIMREIPAGSRLEERLGLGKFSKSGDGFR